MKPHDQLRHQQLNQLLITLTNAYKHYSGQDVPEKVFDLLFNHDPDVTQAVASSVDDAKQAKCEIHRLLWKIIREKAGSDSSAIQWVPGSVKYPALIVQLLRVRFPSPEPDVCLTDCVSYSIEDFIKYTSS
jgi:hypothetical protein